MLLFADGSETTTLTDEDLRSGLYAALDQLGPRR